MSIELNTLINSRYRGVTRPAATHYSLKAARASMPIAFRPDNAIIPRPRPCCVLYIAAKAVRSHLRRRSPGFELSSIAARRFSISRIVCSIALITCSSVVHAR